MPSLAARAIRFIFGWGLRGGKETLDDANTTHQAIQDAYLRPEAFSPPKTLGADIFIDRIDKHDWPLYRVSTLASPKESGTGRDAAIYLHGGSWFREITVYHWSLVAHLARTTELDVLVPIYPLIPRPNATASQVVEGLITICRHSSQPIVCIAGDSAGGTIALALAQGLQIMAPDLAARTKSIVLISPALDLSFEHSEALRIAKRDPWLGIPGLVVVGRLWAGDKAVSDPMVSPLFGDIEKLPPVLILCGTDDLLSADAKRLSARFRGRDNDSFIEGSVKLPKLEYIEAPGMIHVYPLLPCPEGAQARKQISDFITGCLDVKNS